MQLSLKCKTFLKVSIYAILEVTPEIKIHRMLNQLLQICNLPIMESWRSFEYAFAAIVHEEWYLIFESARESLLGNMIQPRLLTNERRPSWCNTWHKQCHNKDGTTSIMDDDQGRPMTFRPRSTLNLADSISPCEVNVKDEKVSIHLYYVIISRQTLFHVAIGSAG